MRKSMLWVLVVLFVAGAAYAATGAGEDAPKASDLPWPIDKSDKGEADKVLEGGIVGNVPFPHHLHQETVDCVVCHQYFPQKEGALRARIDGGELKKKTVMNQCTACHRELNREQGLSVPTGCRDCHSVKDKK